MHEYKKKRSSGKNKVKVEVILRPTISRRVCPDVRPPSGSVTNFSFSLSFSLDSCESVAPSLTRGRVGNLLLLLSLACLVSLDHILLFHFLRLAQPGGPVLRIYIFQEQGGPDIPPGTGFHFRSLLRLA
jgi:hypothetical protein